MGGIYLYPLLKLPPKIIQQAKTLQVGADALYCEKLLEEQAVHVGAGCFNCQPTGSYHLRLHILVPPDLLEEALTRLRTFHQRIMES